LTQDMVQRWVLEKTKVNLGFHNGKENPGETERLSASQESLGSIQTVCKQSRCLIRTLSPDYLSIRAKGSLLAALCLCALEAPTFLMNITEIILGAPAIVFR
jgi:hypothetical protein